MARITNLDGQKSVEQKRVLLAEADSGAEEIYYCASAGVKDSYRRDICMEYSKSCQNPDDKGKYGFTHEAEAFAYDNIDLCTRMAAQKARNLKEPAKVAEKTLADEQVKKAGGDTETKFFIRNHGPAHVDTDVLQGSLEWPKDVSKADLDAKIFEDRSAKVMLSYVTETGKKFRYCIVAGSSFDTAVLKLRSCKDERVELPTFKIIPRGSEHFGPIDTLELGRLVMGKNPVEASIHQNITNEYAEIALTYKTQSGDIKNFAIARGTPSRIKTELLLDALKDAKEGETKIIQAAGPDKIKQEVTW